MARLNEPPAAHAASVAPAILHPAGPPTINTLEAGEHMMTRRVSPTMRDRVTSERRRAAADFEEVKRNLIRQNRNLARVNSTQSLQIRTLGAEVSRLLAVNIELREELISVRNRINSQPRNDDRANRLMVVQRLREAAQLLECDCGKPDDDTVQASPETRKSLCLEGMEFRERPSLREIMASSRMPTIRESRVYPRPRPECFETSPAKVNDGSTAESPELGTPPVVRMPEEAAQTAAETPTAAATTEAAPDINIETRKRRKLSSSGVSVRRRSDFVSPLLESDAMLFKSGPKRRLLGTEDDDGQKPAKLARQGGARSPRRSIKVFEESNDHLVAPVLSKPTRRALTEKSSNLSPKKVVREEKDNKKAPFSGEQKAVQITSAPVSHLKVASIELDDQMPNEHTSVEQAMPPITPGQVDMLSPLSSERSFAGTPPPMDLSMMLSTTSDQGSRPSRRARAAVNYAEPSLVAKMRRPSKAMVDALTGLQDPRRTMQSPKMRRLSGVDGGALVEQDDYDTAQQSKEQPSLEEQVSETSSSFKLSSLMAAGKARSVAEKRREDSIDMAIFDFEDTTVPSSPAEVVEAPRTNRRHSAAAKANDRMMPDTEAGRRKVVASNLGKASTVAGRRRSMMV